MYEVIRSKIVKVRKLHKCFGCRSRIDIGQKAEVNTNILDDKIYSVYFCMFCLEYQKKYCDKCKSSCKDDYGFDEGYIQECANYPCNSCNHYGWCTKLDEENCNKIRKDN